MVDIVTKTNKELKKKQNSLHTKPLLIPIVQKFSEPISIRRQRAICIIPVDILHKLFPEILKLTKLKPQYRHTKSENKITEESNSLLWEERKTTVY